MNLEQRIIIRTALDLVAAGNHPEPVATGLQLAVVAKELGTLAASFRLGRDLIDHSLAGLEIHLVAVGFLAGEAIRNADWSDTAVYDPVQAMEKTVDLYVAVLALASLLGERLGLPDVDLDGMALARTEGLGRAVGGTDRGTI